MEIELTKEEMLEGTALGIIGISLPLEWCLRVHRLVEMARKKGLGNITTSDAADIINYANREYERRKELKNKDNGQVQD